MRCWAPPVAPVYVHICICVIPVSSEGRGGAPLSYFFLCSNLEFDDIYYINSSIDSPPPARPRNTTTTTPAHIHTQHSDPRGPRLRARSGNDDVRRTSSTHMLAAQRRDAGQTGGARGTPSARHTDGRDSPHPESYRAEWACSTQGGGGRGWRPDWLGTSHWHHRRRGDDTWTMATLHTGGGDRGETFSFLQPATACSPP